MKRPNAALALTTMLAAGVCARPADAAGKDTFRLMLNGGFWGSKASFGDTRSYTEWAEKATVDTRYEMKTAFGPDVAVEVNLYRNFGLLAGFSGVSRGETGTFDARSPHPLYLDQPRRLAGDLKGYEARERAVHFDLAYAPGGGRFGWAVFAGVTRFQVEADLLDQLSYDQSYPYDELTLKAAPAKRLEATPIGFNVGGTLDYRFVRSIGVGVEVRYSVGNVKLQAPDATAATFKAGGLQAAAGLRLFF